MEANSVPTNPEENGTPLALCNDVVLQNIFKYLSYKDLNAVREVKNCQWLQNSKKAWWSRTKVTFTFDQNIQDRVTDYLNQHEIASKVTNYVIEFFNAKNLDCFWINSGHSIKYLELKRVTFDTVDDFRRIIYTQCANLETLVFESVETAYQRNHVEPLEWQDPQFGQQTKLKYFESEDDDLPVSWFEFLSHFPNLETLKVVTWLDDIYKTISIIREHDPKSLKLKHVELTGLLNEIDGQASSVYLDPKLSLETICIDKALCQPETFRSILRLHGKSLRELRVRGDVYACNNKQLPLCELLVKLEKLAITHCILTASIFKYIPNVRKVEIECCTALNLTVLPTGASSYSIQSCRELTLQFNIGCFDDSKSDLAFFMNLFPNVEIFKTTGLTNLQFPSICEQWKKLRKFDCNSLSQVNVAGLLGYDPETSHSREVRRSNIGDLKELQFFSMTGIERAKMKHAGLVVEVLKGIPNLKTFCLIGYTLVDQVLWENIFAKYPGE